MSPTLLGTLVMYINGAANLYFNNGAEYIGAAQKYQTVAQPARIAVASAPRLLSEAVKTTATDLPNAQHHYIYLISKNGIYCWHAALIWKSRFCSFRAMSEPMQN